MNTEKIEKILKGDAYAKQIFKGFYPCDKIPTDVKYPSKISKSYNVYSTPIQAPNRVNIRLHSILTRKSEENILIVTV